MSKPTIASLCSGAGISELGVQTHFNTLLAIDNNWRACCSFMANHHGVRVVCDDVCSPDLMAWAGKKYAGIDGLIGTFPCPSFSKAGDQEPNDPRSKVLLSVLPWTEALKPRFIILENVPELLKFPHFWLVFQGLQHQGYTVRVWLLDAMDFGSAQRRPRLFIVAVREGERIPVAPEPTHGPGRVPYRTIRDAIGDMPAEERMRLGCDKLSLKRAAVMEPVPDGGNWRCLTGWRRQFVLNSAAKVGHKPQERTCRRYREDDVSDTVMTGVQIKKVTLPLPPRSIVGENRPFSVTEVLRLMDVEEPYHLHGTKAQRYMFPGNGVPARLMRAVCGAVARIFQEPVLVVPESGNTKIGELAATYVSQVTCPNTCPFRNNGCYAELGNCGNVTRRLNRSLETDLVEIATLEAREIDALPGDRDLRVHVVGDCPTEESAVIVGAAMVRYEHRTGRRAFTYTHAWRTVPSSAWQGANVLASCESIADVQDARALGYATSMVVPEHASPKAYSHENVRVVPCPNQTLGRTCEQCRLCMRTEILKEAGLTIAFDAHGARSSIVKSIVRCNVPTETLKEAS